MGKFKLYFLRFLEALGYFVGLILLIPVFVVREGFHIILHCSDIMQGSGSGLRWEDFKYVFSREYWQQ